LKTNIGNLLRKRAYMHPEKEAFVDLVSGERFSYAEYNKRTNRAANALLSLGVGKGDRVALLLQNGNDFMELFFAIAKIGAICVPLNWRLAAEELAYILKDSGACTLVFGANCGDVVADIQSFGNDATNIRQWLWLGNEPNPKAHATSFDILRQQAPTSEPQLAGFEDDLLYIMYTSGTTGMPKGVMHSHNGALWAIASMAATWELRQSDRFLVALPLFHVGGLSPALMAVYCGISAVVPGGFDAAGFWKIIASERVSNSLMVPTLLTLMLQSEVKGSYDHSSLRWLAVSGAPVPISLLEAYNALGVELQQLYGLTEACGPGCQLTGKDVARKAGSAGHSFLHNEIRVVDGKGIDVPVGERGELVIQGKHVMQGYWNQPEATAAALRDGWLHTGDIATIDEEGFVFIVDRLKDMIISGGENIYPAEIEKVIAGIAGVIDVAVIAQVDSKWGETPVAIVERSDLALNEKTVLDFCKGKLAGYKVPKAVVFIDTLPRTSSGKVKKATLRTMFSSRMNR